MSRQVRTSRMAIVVIAIAVTSISAYAVVGSLSAGAASGTTLVAPHNRLVAPTSTLFVSEQSSTRLANPPGGIAAFDPTDLAAGATTQYPSLSATGAFSGPVGTRASVVVGSTLVGLDTLGTSLRLTNLMTGTHRDVVISAGQASPAGLVFGMALSPNGADLYLVGTTNGDLQSPTTPIVVTEMSTFTWTFVHVYAVSGPSGLGVSTPSVDPDTGDLWIPTTSGTVVVNPSTSGGWSATTVLGGQETGQVAFDGPDAWVPTTTPVSNGDLIEIATSNLSTVQTVSGAGGLAAVAAPDAADIYVLSAMGGPGGSDNLDVLAVSTASAAVDNLGSLLSYGDDSSVLTSSALAMSADGSTVFAGAGEQYFHSGNTAGQIWSVDTTTNTISKDEGITGDIGTGNAVPLVTDLTPVPSAPNPSSGYWEAAADGGVFSWGAARFFGSMGGIPLNAPIVGMSPAPGDSGYWEAAADGGVFSFGSAGFFGSMGGQPLNAPVVGIAPGPGGVGYWLVAADGGVFSFGSAAFHGSMGGKPLNAPIVGIAPTPDGGGYWLVAADGGVFGFGDAGFYGSMGGTSLNAPVVGMSPDPATGGYWLVAADGGIFSFNAPFSGSAVGSGLATPARAMATVAGGSGYWILGADGGLDGFGTAGNFGSMGGTPLNAPVVGMAATEATG